jgi:hypothetical protein
MASMMFRRSSPIVATTDVVQPQNAARSGHLGGQYDAVAATAAA